MGNIFVIYSFQPDLFDHRNVSCFSFSIYFKTYIYKLVYKAVLLSK